jgi:hypothetical protein
VGFANSMGEYISGFFDAGTLASIPPPPILSTYASGFANLGNAVSGLLNGQNGESGWIH